MNRGRARLVVMAASLVLSGCFGASASPSGWASARPTAFETPAATGPTDAPSATPTVPAASPIASPSSPTSPAPTPSAVPTASPAPAWASHTVVAGDTLASIARRYDTTWQSLLSWNRSTYPSLDPDDPSYDPNVIRVGWVLRLIPGTSVPFDAPLPTPPLTPVPTVAPTVPPGSSASTLMASGSRATMRVALTFDMGGRVEPALPIMTWLRDHGVPATIFMTGSMADSTVTDAGRQVLARVDARPDLFDLGNHSYAHPDLTVLSAAAIVDQIARTEASIDRYAAQSPRPFFRPPFGAWNDAVLAAVGAAGYRYTVMWDVDTIDWKPIDDGGPTAQQIVDKVVSRAQGGSIVLMHLGGYETLQALPGIVAGLQSRGFSLVTLGTMVGS